MQSITFRPVRKPDNQFRSIEDVLEHIAQLYDAECAGLNKFAALCPCHPDRNPSLKFGIRNGVVVIRCHAGCDTAGVLAARGLSFKNLYVGGPPPTREQRRIAAAEQAEREHKQQVWNMVERRAAAHCRQCSKLHLEVRNRLIAAADDASGDALAATFHQTLDGLREAEAECEKLALLRRRAEKLDRDYYARLHQLHTPKAVA